MEVRNCRGCGRLFNYVGGVSYTNLCPVCIEELEEKFQKAKKYIDENKGVGINEVAEYIDVRPSQVEKWVREERLCFSKESAVTIGCEKCGARILSGRFCDKCKNDMARTLGGLYGNVYQPERTRKSSAPGKMRFLDN